ncbi:MAG: gamma-glutamyltransferase [Flavobacteriaceae bacterium]|nr:gamma-glutamyltransferase [Flavobacteriaceae bacterium]|tara:strand:- start:206 stop:1879 length:1674 start_codon:yes stop_codon:yes gene_type:complete
MRKNLLVCLVIILNFLSCESNKPPIKAAVVSARIEASKIGIGILEKGGNAFDAMIATDLALAVCYPNAGNIGGGGFLVYRKSDGSVGSLDYREKAPLASYKDMYLDSDGNVIEGKSTIGGMAIGVPGTVAGLYEVHNKLGTLPWEELVQPAIDLATNGYIVTINQANSFSSKRNDFVNINGEETLFAKEFKPGDTVINIQLANTLKEIQKNGKSGFYNGIVAENLVSEVQKAGGIITMQDLDNYKPIWRNPIEFSYKNLKITSMGPPSSGGICLAQMMKMIEPYDISQYSHNSLESIQLMTEAERRTYADRSEYLGDSDFYPVPVSTLIDSTYLLKRMKDFNWEKATLSTNISAGPNLWNESDETTHYSIVDQYGNAVAVTTTLNASYGSKVYVENGGYFLNNEMDDFVSKPGVPNMFGLTGSIANSIEPEKRMLSSMTPTIIEKDNNLFMILGTPGGSTIITSVFQTILNAYEFNMDIQESVNASRFHHQWLPDLIVLEPDKFDSELINKLISKGYFIDEKASRIIGRVDAILVNKDGVITTGADPRGDDAAAVLR